jgi:hypothetical protein
LSQALYCAPGDVRQVLTGLNQGGTAAELQDVQLNAAILRASAKVSAWCGQQYGTDGGGNAVPIPGTIFAWSAGLAAYYATLTYRKGKPLDKEDPISALYEDILDDLTAVSKGYADPDPQTPNKNVSSPGHVRNMLPPIFSPSDSNTEIDVFTGRLSNTLGAGDQF